MNRSDGLRLAEVRLVRTGMTKADIEERQLRRLEKRICHLAGLLHLTQLAGDPCRHGRVRMRVRELIQRENARMWELLHPDGEPEDQARK